MGLLHSKLLSLVACFHSPDEVAIFVSKTKENSVEFPDRSTYCLGTKMAGVIPGEILSIPKNAR